MTAISDAEAEVMEVLWDGRCGNRFLTSRDIVESLGSNRGWSPKTVRTLLDRLYAKGAVERQLDGRVYTYRPLLAREDWLETQARELVDRHCHGRLAPLVSAFAGSHGLSDEDRREILALLGDDQP